MSTFINIGGVITIFCKIIIGYNIWLKFGKKILVYAVQVFLFFPVLMLKIGENWGNHQLDFTANISLKVVKPSINTRFQYGAPPGILPASHRNSSLNCFYSLCVAMLLQLVLLFESSVCIQIKKQPLWDCFYIWCTTGDSNPGPTD